tara:strand:+ start:4580 stop:5152 length:573 start_codon:yes stop_codon:yes gene_type:complete
MVIKIMQNFISKIPNNIDAIHIQDESLEHEFMFSISSLVLQSSIARKVLRESIPIIKTPITELVSFNGEYARIAVLSYYFNHITLRVLDTDTTSKLAMSSDQEQLSSIPIVAQTLSSSPQTVDDLPNFLVEQARLIETKELNKGELNALFNWLASQVPETHLVGNPFTQERWRKRWGELMDQKAGEFESA